MIFAVTFSICYLFSAPQQMLGRAFGLAIFVAIASISNEQSYSFLVVADTSLMFVLVFFILMITAYIPFSPHPERAFLRLLCRFFRSSEYLISTMHRKPNTKLDNWKKIFYTRQLTCVPNQLVTWGRFINPNVLPGATSDQVSTLNYKLQSLSYRMQELLEIGDSIQNEFLLQELLEDICFWQFKVHKAFQHLSDDPTFGNKERFRDKLTEIMNHFEERIKETLNKNGKSQLSAQDGEKFYRLLGAYRGVSEALVGYTGSTDDIDWSHGHEERF